MSEQAGFWFFFGLIALTFWYFLIYEPKRIEKKYDKQAKLQADYDSLMERYKQLWVEHDQYKVKYENLKHFVYGKGYSMRDVREYHEALEVMAKLTENFTFVEQK
jgi:hypothetical protein